MCWRLQPVSSRLSSGSGRYGSSLEWLFLRCLGLDDTQQDVVFPMLQARLQSSAKANRGAFYPAALFALPAENGAVTRLARPGARSKPSPVPVSVTHPQLQLRLQSNVEAQSFKTTFKRWCRGIMEPSVRSETSKRGQERSLGSCGFAV